MSLFRKVIDILRWNRSERSRTGFVLRNWGGASDINILSKALQAETFRSYLRAKPHKVEKKDKILVIAPHQDDEIIGVGGLLVQARDKGAQAAILFATNGDQKKLVLSGKRLSSEEIIATRKKEAKEVCHRLGATFHELGIENISMEINQSHIDTLADLIFQQRPDFIFTPWLFDGTVKHRAINLLLYLALKQTKPGLEPQVWGYQVNNPIFSNIVLDITNEINEKVALIEIYRSQNYGVKNYAHITKCLGGWNSRFLANGNTEGKESYAELYFAIPADEYTKLIEKYYLPDLNKALFGKAYLVKQFSSL